MSGIGLFLMVMALLVNAPRFILVFLVAEGVTLPPFALSTAGVISGLGNGALITGGIGFVFHRWGDADKRGLARARLLLMVGITFLAFSIVILAPWVAGSITGRGIANVLQSPTSVPILVWFWSIVAVTSVDLVVAGSVIAQSVTRKQTRVMERDKNVVESDGSVPKRGERSYADFVRAIEAGEIDLNELNSVQIALWAGRNESTIRKWRARYLAERKEKDD